MDRSVDGASVSREQLEGLGALTAVLRPGPTTREVFVDALAAISKIIPADAYAIWRYDLRDTTWRIVASRGLSDQYSAVTIDEPTRSTAVLAHPFHVAEVSHAGLLSGRQQMYATEKIQSIYVIPLQANGDPTGTLTCYFREPRSEAPIDESLGRAIGNIVSAAVATRTFERLAAIARVVSAELDVHQLVQTVTDAATELTGAAFGAFFYNVDRGGESYMLYTISGVPREAFEKFPMPRNTQMFGPTFRGEGPVRIADIRKDPRYGHSAPHFGLPPGHLPVTSYLAIPVISRSGTVLGGLFFGHPEAGVFTENEQEIAEALAAQAAVGIDNAHLYAALQNERATLARNALRYKSLVLATPRQQAIGVMTPDGRNEDSPSWREITGQSIEEIESEGYAAAVHPEDRERVLAKWRDAIAQQSVYSDQYRLRMRDGAYRYFESKGVPVIGDDGAVIEWVWTVTDVHDRRVAEESLKFLTQSTEMLTEALDYEEALKLLAQLAVPAIADWCAVDVIPEHGVPESYRRLAVTHVDPAKVEYALELRRRFPPDPSRDQVVAVMRSGKPQWVPQVPDGYFEEYITDPEQLRIIQEIGITSWIVAPLEARGRVIGAVTFVSADSRRHLSEAEFTLAQEFARRAAIAIDNARLYSQAQAANRAKDEFLATLSHELRTPMTAVLGWARMLQMGLSAEESREAVSAIEKSAVMQAQLIEDILDMSRVMAGKLRIDSDPVDLREVVGAALSTVHPAAAARDIEILTSYSPDLPAVAGDQARLQQVIWNLLTNAIKFTPKKGRITVRIEVEGSVMSVSVEDSGIGIRGEFLPYVFEPFRQQDSSTTRSHGGVGLGLAIAKHLVEMHGGRIRAESAGEGAGAKFTVELPVLESTRGASLAGQAPSRSAGDPGAPLPRLDGTSVLVIDDQSYTRDVVAAMLRHCGASATTVGSANEGLDSVSSAMPDVIVCDIAMPQEDGYSFVRRLRASPAGARIPVIALTAFGRNEDRELALTAGFSAYLKKPVEPADLALTIKRVTRA